ncbi:MAG: undecaprenyl-diphosphate phosphatase [Bacteroidetes bacterium]|nr:MAG: undecaprenyl-diphosphate phosphatase [Bacteroidota bacterium]
MTWVDALILGIIEGITEFLPISSTGHLIIGSAVLGLNPDDFLKLFTVAIQLGAILSVIVLYFKKFFDFSSSDAFFRFYMKLLVAFIPSAVIGVLLNDIIDRMMENPVAVSVFLLLGGVFFVYSDKLFADNKKTEKHISFKDAFMIGLFQCIAMFPGVSRSGATIIGGLFRKLTKKAAAEFSFFLAVPTMFGATAKKMYDFFKYHDTISQDEWQLLLFGNIVAFVVALMAIKFFISLLQKTGFALYGWYRILLGSIILMLYFSGVSLHIV